MAHLAWQKVTDGCTGDCECSSPDGSPDHSIYNVGDTISTWCTDSTTTTSDGTTTTGSGTTTTGSGTTTTVGESGACCDGEDCHISPSQDDCEGSSGRTFQGVGTVCTPNPCGTTITGS